MALGRRHLESWRLRHRRRRLGRVLRNRAVVDGSRVALIRTASSDLRRGRRLATCRYPVPGTRYPVSGVRYADRIYPDPMPLIRFTPTLQRHVACSDMQVAGTSVRDALGEAFGALPALRSYLVDEQGALRKHVTVFVDGAPIRDRSRLSDVLEPGSEIDVMQALSGG